MDTTDNKGFKTSFEGKELWLEEIIRETEHHYHGEIQQDQRSSWLLATSCLLMAIVVSIEVTALEKGIKLSQPVIITALIAFAISSIFSILTLWPLYGIRIWKDLFGKTYRRTSRLGINNLLQERFRLEEDWPCKDYEKRIKYHFRSHYLRNMRKAYGVFWSSLFLLLGLILFAVQAIIILS